MKYFYDDVLEATWMANKFGMKFQHIETNTNKNFDFENEEHILNNHGPYYIHSDSLELLEPGIGDIIKSPNCVGIFHAKNIDGGWFFRRGWSDLPIAAGEDFAFTRDGKIIERDRIPFMWPEVKQ